MYNQVTKDRVASITQSIISELVAFQIERKEIKKTFFGVVDVPLFRLRFRMIAEEDIRDDVGYEVVRIQQPEDVTFDLIFWPIARKGYLCYIRNRLPVTMFQILLQHKDLWQTILKASMEEAKGVNPFKYNYIKLLIKKPLYEILSTNPAAFDWII